MSDGELAEAIVASSAYGVSFVGDPAGDGVAASGTTVPVLFASALIEQLLVDVPPLPSGVLATLQRDPELAAALGRVSAPVSPAMSRGFWASARASWSPSCRCSIRACRR